MKMARFAKFGCISHQVVSSFGSLSPQFESKATNLRNPCFIVEQKSVRRRLSNGGRRLREQKFNSSTL